MNSRSILKRLGAVILLALILAAPGLAQRRWERVYRDSTSDACANFACQTLEGGYVTIGTSLSGTFYVEEALIQRLDVNGDTIWTRTCFHWPDRSRGAWICPMPGGGYMAIASVPNSRFDYIPGLMRLDDTGNAIWWRGFATDSTAELIACGGQPTRDGGYIVLVEGLYG